MPPRYHLIRFEGLVDISRYPEIREAFAAVPDGMPVLIDLTRAESVDSPFLSEALLFKRRHNAGLAVVIPPGGHLARLFDIVNLGAKMNVYQDMDSAVAWLSSPDAGGDAATPEGANVR